MGERQVLDCMGVPEFFSTHIGSIEDIGSGLIRIVRCVERNGELIPVFSCVMPAMSVLNNWTVLRDLVERVACRQISGANLH